MRVFIGSFTVNCVRGTRTQPLICVRCFVHHWVSCAINKGGFFEIAFVLVVVDTHLPRLEALAYVLPHFDALAHWVIRVPSAFIFQTFAEVCYSVFVNRSPLKVCLIFVKPTDLRVCWRPTIYLCEWIFQNVHFSKVCWKFTLWVTFYFGLSLHIFLWKMRATPDACIKPGCLARLRHVKAWVTS